MAVYEPCYCTREDVKSAADILQTADYNVHVDSAIQAAAADVRRLCKRRFHNVDETNYWNWPNFQYAYPWRIWFDERELADVTVNVPVVTTGSTVIPAGAIFWGPWNYSPPFTFLELDRSQSYSFGLGDTPQRDVSITGTFGYWIQSKAAGTLAADAGGSDATITVSDSSVVGVGDTITIGSERMLVSDRALTDTGVAFTGLTEALANDNVLTVPDGTAFAVGEVLGFDSELCLITNIIGDNLTLIRAWDGSSLAAHTSGDIYAARQLSVLRGGFGTAAASHTSGDAITALIYPGQVRELAIAESLNYVAQKSATYARTLAAQSSAVPGAGLPDLRARVYEAFGRKARQRVI